MTENSTADRSDRAAARSPEPSLILVVEPDQEIRESYLTALAAFGWVADGVTDGREALAKVFGWKPAAVVTETHVPGLDGVELCRLLKNDLDTRTIPILVVTDDGDEPRIATAKRAGADAVLIKPCLPDQLVRAVHALLGTLHEPPRSPRSAGLPGQPTSPGPHRPFLSRVHRRGETSSPPSPPPSLVCPRCNRLLLYERSHIGGVNASHGEQWDDFRCLGRCGRFQYRHRTRKLRELM